MMILITRGRPQGLKRFIDAYRETQAGAPVLMYFDGDDPLLPEYKELLYPSHWQRMIGPRLRPGPTYNLIFKNFPNEDYYGMLADDIVPLTANWDEKLIERAGKDALAYPDDGIWGEEIATHPVIGGDLVRAVGFLVYDQLKQYFGDTWWTYVAKKLGVAHYCPDVIYDHRHHMVGKSEVDQTYREKWPDAETDRAIYEKFISNPESKNYIEELRREHGKLKTARGVENLADRLRWVC